MFNYNSIKRPLNYAGQFKRNNALCVVTETQMNKQLIISIKVIKQMDKLVIIFRSFKFWRYTANHEILRN